MNEIATTKIETFGKEEINKVIEHIEKEVKAKGFVYKAGKYERGRAKNFYDSKFTAFRNEYLQGASVLDAISFLIKGSAKHDFWNDKIHNAESLYTHYAKLYNALKTDFQNIKGLVIDLSYGTTNFKTPKEGISYLRLFVKVNNQDKDYWILKSDEEKLDYAKANKKAIICLGGERVSPAFIFATENFFIPKTRALPYRKKELTKKDLKKRADTTKKLKEIRETKKKELFKQDNDGFCIKNKYSHISPMFDMGGDKEKELLNKLNK